MMGMGSPISKQALAKTIQGQVADAIAAKDGAAKGSGIFSLFDGMSGAHKLGLGLAGASLLGGLIGEEEDGGGRRPEGPPGQAFGSVVGRSGRV